MQAPKVLKEFVLPTKLRQVSETATSTFTCFVLDPLEKGFGHTLGNAFRRILLSSIEGAAITSVKIEGIQHEFQHDKGIFEDVTEIVLNLKKVLLKARLKEPVTLSIDVNKLGAVTAKDIKLSNGIEVVNPEQVICTLTEKRRFKAELTVDMDRNYRLAKDNRKPDQALGTIPIDSLFSPVTLVSYHVENTRVGNITDYDKLFLEVTTDGRITPQDAVKEASAILSLHLKLFEDLSEEAIRFESSKTSDESVGNKENRLHTLLQTSVNVLDLSVRSANCLNKEKIMTLGQLARRPESELLQCRNFGKKSLDEIKEKLESFGLSLGMQIDENMLSDSLR